MDKVLIEYLRQDRATGGCFNTGDVAGWPKPVADKLVAQGFAKLHDAGKGPGVPNMDLSIPHAREEWENDENPVWLKRKALVEKAMTKEAVALREKNAAK